MKKQSTFATCVLALAMVGAGLGCDNTQKVSLMGVELKESFLVWSPTQALITKHVNWHDMYHCSDTPGSIYRKCTNPGKDFLDFHRKFLSDLRADYIAHGGNAADTTPWTRLPPEIKTSPLWTSTLQQKEDAIFSLIDTDGTTPFRFEQADYYGTYIETFYHNYLHGITATTFHEDAVAPIGTSPTSTYFFKIHGLIEMLYQRFQRGDFNDDGYSDIFERNPTTGEDSIRLLNNNQTVPLFVNIDNVPVNSCNYYVGATTDLDYDGNIDLIWHGPGCSSTVFWKMGKDSSGHIVHTGPDVYLPGVNSGWTLIGSGDFNKDLRPDLVWKNNSTLDVSIWAMNGTTYTGSLNAVDVPAGYTPIGTADLFDDGTPDLVLQGGTYNAKTYAGLSLDYANGLVTQLGPPIALTNVNHADMYTGFSGAGRFGGSRYPGDLLFERHTPGGGTYSFSLTNGAGSYTDALGNSMDNNHNMQGPR